MPDPEARPVRSWTQRERPLLAPAGDIHCRILFADEVRIDPSWRVQLCDPFWRLYMNRDEGAWVTGTGGSQPIPAGRMVLVPAWNRLQSGCHGPVVHRFVHLDPMGLGGDWVREHCPRPIVLPADVQREAGFTRLFDQRDGGAVWRLRLQAVVLEALAEALAGLPASALEQHRLRQERIDPVAPALAFVEEHLVQALPTEQLARCCGLSPDHFARVFRERIGQSPARYVQERRVAVAAERLLATADDIPRIAADSGFANRFHFTRVFTAHMGMPPAAYRRTGRW